MSQHGVSSPVRSTGVDTRAGVAAVGVLPQVECVLIAARAKNSSRLVLPLSAYPLPRGRVRFVVVTGQARRTATGALPGVGDGRVLHVRSASRSRLRVRSRIVSPTREYLEHHLVCL